MVDILLVLWLTFQKRLTDVRLCGRISMTVLALPLFLHLAEIVLEVMG